jgi:hypothetical protein
LAAVRPDGSVNLAPGRRRVGPNDRLVALVCGLVRALTRALGRSDALAGPSIRAGNYLCHRVTL